MKRDVNLFLLGLLVLIIISMVGLGVYFQNEYKSLASEYNTALDKLQEKNAELDKKIIEINNTRAELDAREASLVDIVKELNLTKEKQTSLGGFFENLKGEKETLQENLSSTQDEVKKWKLNYNNANNDLGICQNNIKNKDDQLNKKDARINYMNLKVQDASRYFSQTNENLFFVKKYLAELSSQIDNLYSSTGDYKVPDQISIDARDSIKSDLSDIKSYVNGKLSNSVMSLGNSISSANSSISSIGSA